MTCIPPWMFLAQSGLIGPRYATASLPDYADAGWHWKCTCGAKTSPWIQNWSALAEAAREKWTLHFE